MTKKSQASTMLDLKNLERRMIGELVTKGEFRKSQEAMLEHVGDKISESKESIEDRIRNLPTKEEFFDKMDKLMKEVKDSREEQTVLSHRVSNTEDRIHMIEGKVRITSS